MMEITDIDGSIKENLKVFNPDSANPYADMLRLSTTDLANFEPKKKKKKTKRKSKKNNLDEFLDNNEDNLSE